MRWNIAIEQHPSGWWEIAVNGKIMLKTRMHSSRMRTARLLLVSPSMHCSGGAPVPGGVPEWGVYLNGGLPAWGVYLPGGCTAQGGVPAQGSVPARGSVPAQGDTPPVTPPQQNSWHALLKILPCPKLGLRAVTNENKTIRFRSI